MILPDFETELYSWDRSEHGTFQEIMIDMEPLTNRVYTSRYTYDYVYGNACGSFFNPRASVDKRVLVIGDSMAKTVIPYMALSFEEVVFWSCGSVNTITQEVLDTYEPDIIISLYYPENVIEDYAYNFGL